MVVYMNNKRSSDTLFLCGIILMCFGYLNFMIKPTWIETRGDIWNTITLYIYQLFWKPVETLSFLIGAILFCKSFKK
ncbi:hypothetical protein FAJ35_01060 [Streptococcus suis]|uniref:Uncharacterized protein n=2 Tax=Streptococcus TaxID=1301 RepID=A0A2I5N5W9_STRSU|nr:hypothetical protein CWM22_09395 [Streptococcus suis]HEM3181479.1 hypothetical protein [Streptococcus suis 89-5259]MBY4965361.1 hypothetical protein [Streptococcus suis]MCK3890871.1 hypothetical protein [Streptococcus suis]TII04042.1 hypothetical protein FAJ35_01060 [Streptococcus suis]